MGKKKSASQSTAPPAPPGERTPAGDPDPGRRSLLHTGGRIALGGCGLLLGAGALRTAWPDLGQGGPARLSLGPRSDFHRGSLTYLPAARLFLLHDAEGLGAFSSRCTHLGCALRRSGEGLACPCHGARFDAKGRVLSGPPRRPLPWFALEVDGEGVLWVDLRREVAAGTSEPALAEGAAG
ncbi:MAG: Rieske (2Fe-2S) protein [Deltaproteobacteria bacterium]|nr:Rieske (2Fe-2S) protein [Deltaproteobacteria bacterium]